MSGELPASIKQHKFYNTYITRNDVLALMKLTENTDAFKKYIETNVLSNWQMKNASENRNQVFMDFFCNLYQDMDLH